METENVGSKSSIGVPVAIVLAGLIIAGAIYLKPGGPVTPAGTTGGPAASQASQAAAALEALKKIKPISDVDHFQGNLTAPIKIVEYSDLEGNQIVYEFTHVETDKPLDLALFNFQTESGMDVIDLR